MQSVVLFRSLTYFASYCVCVFCKYLQEEFKTLEEKASNVLEDLEKAQVSCNVILDAPVFPFHFM